MIKWGRIGINRAPGNQGTSVYDFFLKDRVDSGKIPIAYCIIEHIISYLSTKATQGALFVKLHKEIVGWKHVDTL